MGTRKRKRQAPPQIINLLRVKSGSERAVHARLREEGIRSYVPRLLEFPPSGPREVVLFRTYVFVWPEDRWRVISRTRGVIEFVRFGDLPARVPQRVIDELKALEGPTGYIRQTRPFEVGQLVRLGADGKAVPVMELLGRNRVMVLLSILGRETRMTVSETELVAA